MFGFMVHSMIRGYHKYKIIWENPSANDDLLCEHEVRNAHDTQLLLKKYHWQVTRQDYNSGTYSTKNLFNMFDI